MGKVLVRFLLLGVLGLPAVAGASSWKLDAIHSSVLFSVKHMMVTNVRGSLQVTAGSLTLNDKTGLPTKVEGTVDAKVVKLGLCAQRKRTAQAAPMVKLLAEGRPDVGERQR